MPPATTTILFSPCGHSETMPEVVLAIYRRNRVSCWCSLCEEMRPWTESRRVRSRRTRFSARRRAAYGRSL